MNGGVIKSTYQATIQDLILDSNMARYKGGAIFIEGGTLTITGSVLKNNNSTNNAGTSGGAIELDDDINYATGGDLYLSNSCIVGNSSPSLNSLANTAARQAQNNWWGAWDGPKAGGVGGGDAIPTSFSYIPFQTTPPFPECPVLPVITPTQNINVIYCTSKAITLAPYGGMFPYSYSLSTPAHGTLNGTAPNLTYTPTGNYKGTDSFTYTVTDANGSAITGTINITIVTDLLATNQNIVAQNTPGGTPVTLGSTGGWLPITYTIQTNPTHGTLSGSAPNLTYTPNALFTGADSFTFKATDEGGFTSIGTVNLTITWDIDAQNQSLYTPANAAINVYLNTTGTHTPFTFSDISIPVYGTLSGTAPNLVYTPTNQWCES